MGAALRGRLNSVLVPTAVAWAVTGVVAAVWTLLAGGPLVAVGMALLSVWPRGAGRNAPRVPLPGSATVRQSRGDADRRG